MRYQDKRGWLFEVRRGQHIDGYSIYCYNPKKEKWWVWPCASWYSTPREAEKYMKRYAAKRGWKAV